MVLSKKLLESFIFFIKTSFNSWHLRSEFRNYIWNEIDIAHLTVNYLENLDIFPHQQFSFPIQSAGKAAEFFVRGQNAMARNQNRNRIRAARAAHGADGLGPANRPRDFAVAFRFAEGNFPQRVPDAFLKFRSRPIQRRQIFRFAPARIFFSAVSVVRCQARIWVGIPFAFDGSRGTLAPPAGN